MKLFLGVDGGQSRTKALIGDETGRVLGSGSAGPCNHAGTLEGAHKLLSAVTESLVNACERAGIDASHVQFETACFGMSGGPADKQTLLSTIVSARKVVVTHDAMIALAGATALEPGVVTIAGTGSMCFGRNAESKTARAGGWGFVFGDEGGAFDIVRQALRAALRFEEGWGPETLLHSALLDRTGARTANDLVHEFYTADWPRARVATLAKLVDEVALEGDEAAGDILRRAAQELAALTASVRAQLWRVEEHVKLCYTGGVFHSSILLERFRTLVTLEERNRCEAAAYSPVVGALLEAYRAVGLYPGLKNLPTS